jgi:hypothetical protein
MPEDVGGDVLPDSGHEPVFLNDLPKTLAGHSLPPLAYEDMGILLVRKEPLARLLQIPP